MLLEAQRRGIPLTHVAPNFGVEKGTDYRGADGLPGFEARARTLCRIAEEFGVMADFHSGDDLSAASRQAIGRATAGRNHFKVSPNLQLLFAEVLAEHHPRLFRRWWQDALAYASREAGDGSAFARDCIRQSDASTAVVARCDLPQLQLCVCRAAGCRGAVHLPRGVLQPVAGILRSLPGVHSKLPAYLSQRRLW